MEVLKDTSDSEPKTPAVYSAGKLFPNRSGYLLMVLGESAIIAACTAMVHRSGEFAVEPLPDDYFEFWVGDQTDRDGVRAYLEANPIPGALAWQLHVKTDVRWKLIAADAADAVAIMQQYLLDCREEIEPLEEELRPVEQWNPTRVPTAWIPD